MKDVVESWLDGTRSHFPTMINVYSNTINEDNTMSTIAMNAVATATFTVEMREKLEEILISMLDSGTISEELAMEANDTNTLFDLRAVLRRGDLDYIVDQHIIDLIQGKVTVQPLADGSNVDISEFFKCNTPEEAKALRSWAGVFDVEIPTTMSVVEENPMIDQAKEVSKGFRAIVEAKQDLNASMIAMDDIERKSAGAIATALVHALEKKGTLVQDLHYFEDGSHAKNYHFKTSVNFDYRLVAMLSVQLAGVLPYLENEYDMSHVVATAVFRRRFRDIARMNRSIPGAYNDLMDKAGSTHWHEKLQSGLELAIEAGLIDHNAETGTIKHSMKYLGSCISRTGIMHRVEPINVDNRRKERVKGRSNPRKDGTSKAVREAMEYIESQAQLVNVRLLNIINMFVEHCSVQGYAIPAVLQESGHVIHGCNKLADHEAIYSEYFQDLRGRMYQFAHCGPNPQAADMSKALCYHTVQNWVQKGSVQHEMFLNEFFGEVIGNTDSVWATEAYIRRMIANPVGALTYAFSSFEYDLDEQGQMQYDEKGNLKYIKAPGDLPFKKFFSYIDMCFSWVEFEDNGQADVRFGFGPDAKCSGAQIFAILAGCETMAKACGLVTGYDVKPADPYNMSAQEVNKITQGIRNKNLVPSRTITRNEIKTPFMAIQYGGGVPALRYKKFEPTMEALGIEEQHRDKFCKDVVIEGINNAMGPVIGSFINCLRSAVADYCQEHDVDYFDYRHVDGFLCTKKGEANVQMTELPFIINYGGEGTGVIFGSQKTNTGWMVASRTSGILQRENFIYYFPVHFIQGLDAVIARGIALGAKKAGLRGYSTIHDQFRVCLEDAPRLRSEVIPAVYEELFLNNDPVAHLGKQIQRELVWGNPLEGRKTVVSKEILFSNDAYYFE